MPAPKSTTSQPPFPASSTSTLALRVVMMPKDTNHYQTIFGGVILSLIDQAGFVQALRHRHHKWVTAAVDRVEFKAAVHIGDVVNCYARTVREGTTSVTVVVEVEAERCDSGKVVPVTAAQLVMVCIDAEGRPMPWRVDPAAKSARSRELPPLDAHS
jgi:acyl-CoA thioesterase YciA